jgi:hypothetical protein
MRKSILKFAEVISGPKITNHEHVFPSSPPSSLKILLDNDLMKAYFINKGSTPMTRAQGALPKGDAHWTLRLG